MGDYDRIEVSFTGKYADLAKKFYGDSHLDFCSMDCLTEEMDLGLKNRPFNPTDEFKKRRRMKRNEGSNRI